MIENPEDTSRKKPERCHKLSSYDNKKDRMKWTAAVVFSLLAATEAFSPSGQAPRSKTVVGSAVDEAVSADSKSGSTTKDPLLIRAAKGEKTERTPVWMMRQAGRHIKEYRDLCKKYPTFRQRSEIPEVAVEVSLQPWRNYQTDGCILFSDILTPLPGVGFDFTIDEKLGPVMDPIKNWDDMKKVRPFQIFVAQFCYHLI
jgi:uroporphyrinogen decarboxylase